MRDCTVLQRCTTPRHIIRFPDDPDTYESVLISYVQHGTIILTKTKEDLAFEGNYGSWRLTEAETALFSPGKVCVEVRVHTVSGVTPSAYQKEIPVRDVFNDETLDGSDGDAP